MPTSSVALRFLGTAAGGGLTSLFAARVPCTAPVPGGGFTFFDTRSVTPASVAAGGSPPSSQDEEGTDAGR